VQDSDKVKLLFVFYEKIIYIVGKNNKSNSRNTKKIVVFLYLPTKRRSKEESESPIQALYQRQPLLNYF